MLQLVAQAPGETQTNGDGPSRPHSALPLCCMRTVAELLCKPMVM